MSLLTISANVNNKSVINGREIAFNDIYLDEFNNIAMSTDLQATLEECAEAARTLLGEAVFDTSIGIPYKEVVWVGVPNMQQFTASLRSAFLNVVGVTEVVSLIIAQIPIQTTNNNFPVSSQSADMLTYTAIIKTIYGIGVVQ